MGASYRTPDGSLAFVYSSASTEYPRYYTVLMKERSKGVRRLCRRLLPLRYTEAEAEKDLQYYAWLHKWPVAYEK